MSKNSSKKAKQDNKVTFNPMIEAFSAFHVPFTTPGRSTTDLKQIDACCACTACSACTACG